MYRTGDTYEATLLVSNLTHVQVEDEEFNLILVSLLSALKTKQAAEIPQELPKEAADGTAAANAKQEN